MQFDTTINRWHTAANTGRINGSNPCSEYMHLDNSACNLASLNLLKFLDIDESFDVDGFRHAVEVLFTGQEILVGRADYPTEAIADTSRRFRQLGIGYANLGALLMALGLPYDSDGGRAYAAAVTSLMTGHAYEVSARTASRMGPFAGFAENREHMLRVLGQHQEAAARIDEELVPPDLLSAAQESWDMACELGERYGVRNSQASVLAPTGTIGLMMDCDTTGIEPDLGLVKLKKLVGGGNMSIVNQTVPRALEQLGYGPGEIDDIVASIDEHKSIVGAPHLLAEHLPVFACSMGDNVIHYSGHVKMMAAVQPFISGAISKTVNMPEEATVDEVEKLHIDAWRLGVKAIAIYRDNCKVGQPLSTAKKEAAAAPEPGASAAAVATHVVEKIIKVPVREKLPRNRNSHTFEFRVADCKGFVTVGEYGDGRPGEIFLKVSKQGSTLAGIMDAFSISVSYGLQYGVPLRNFVEAFTNTRFEPAGHHRRPRPAHRHFDPRLHLPPAGGRLPQLRGAGRAGHPHHGGAHPADAAGRGGDGRRDPPRPGRAGRPAVDRLVVAHAVRHPRRPQGAVPAGAGRGDRCREAGPGPHLAGHQAPGGLQRRRPLLHAVRRADAAGRVVPRLPVVRQHQRLQLRFPIGV